jgi:hypothetical protein
LSKTHKNYQLMEIVTILIFRIALGVDEVVNTTLIIHCIENKVQYIPSLLFFKVDTMARLLMVINASVNFLVYCAGSAAFQVRGCKSRFKRKL